MSSMTIYEESWPDAATPRQLRLKVEPTAHGSRITIDRVPGDVLLVRQGKACLLELTIAGQSAKIVMSWTDSSVERREDAYRNAWDALRMIREAVEAHMPAGVLPSSEHTGVEPTEEAEAIVKAIVAMGTQAEKLRAALEPVAVLGVARPETDIALLDYNLPFYDCPDDLVLYNDRMGHAITVGDVRAAKEALRSRKR